MKWSPYYPINSPEYAVRFWSKVQPANDNACWLWMRATNQDGYGNVSVNAACVHAHRVAFRLVNGYLPKAVRHTCDNPLCCNPNHLLPGTQADNVRDMFQRGRARKARGESHSKAYLTEVQVKAMLADFTSGAITNRRLLAEKYGCTKSTAQNITARRCWKHILAEPV